jgi:hypothetical protein
MTLPTTHAPSKLTARANDRPDSDPIGIGIASIEVANCAFALTHMIAAASPDRNFDVMSFSPTRSRYFGH